MATALELSKRYNSLLKARRIDTPRRLQHFFAQLDHESNLTAQRESLYYKTILQARKSFYSPFLGKSDLFVASYLRNTEKMANYVYANRMGNGSESSGDGFKYRGGGYLQHTGLNEMKLLKARTGIDFVNNPDLLTVEVNAFVAAIDGWNRRGLSAYADKDDLDTISDIINIGRPTERYGDSNGFKDRAVKLRFYKQIFK